jgi:hypothetical protein
MHDKGTAADVSRDLGAPAEQSEYLEAITPYANPGCSGAGLKKCAGCLKEFFRGPRVHSGSLASTQGGEQAVPLGR